MPGVSESVRIINKFLPVSHPCLSLFRILNLSYIDGFSTAFISQNIKYYLITNFQCSKCFCINLWTMYKYVFAAFTSFVGSCNESVSFLKIKRFENAMFFTLYLRTAQQVVSNRSTNENPKLCYHKFTVNIFENNWKISYLSTNSFEIPFQITIEEKSPLNFVNKCVFKERIKN